MSEYAIIKYVNDGGGYTKEESVPEGYCRSLESALSYVGKKGFTVLRYGMFENPNESGLCFKYIIREYREESKIYLD